HRALPLVVDITKPDDCDRLVNEARREFGRIDFLVNNAAAGRGRDRVPLLDLEESEWRRVLDVNLNGTFLVTKAVGRALVEQGEVVELVAFICGPDASYIHGQTINIDGGRLML